MTEFINKVRELPDGVRRLVFDYFPRHDTAAAIKDAIKNKHFHLKYVRSRQFPVRGSKALPNDWTLATSSSDLTISNNIIVWHLKELRPTRLISDTYGDGAIERTDISVGERVRLQAIKKGLMAVIHDSKHNIRLIRRY